MEVLDGTGGSQKLPGGVERLTWTSKRGQEAHPEVREGL